MATPPTSPASTAGWLERPRRHLTVVTNDGRPRRHRRSRLAAAEAGRPDAGDRRRAARALSRGAIASPKQQATAAKLTAERRVLPDARLDVARIRQTDADIRYRAESVDAGPLPIRQVALHAQLDHGLLTVDPLSLVLPQGALSGHIRLDARGATPLTTVDLRAGATPRSQELLPRHGAGRAPIEGRWRRAPGWPAPAIRCASAAGSANGVVAVAIPHGQMRQLFAELLGIDVGRSLFLYLSKDQKPTPVRCAVAEFQAQNGLLTAQRLMVDTGAVRAEGGGVIDLRDET